MSNRITISSTNGRDKGTQREEITGDFSDLVQRKYTREMLTALSDAELKASEKELVKHINGLRAKNKSTHSFEIELCYVQDEVNRRAAVSAHMSYKDS